MVQWPCELFPAHGVICTEAGNTHLETTTVIGENNFLSIEPNIF